MRRIRGRYAAPHLCGHVGRADIHERAPAREVFCTIRCAPSRAAPPCRSRPPGLAGAARRRDARLALFAVPLFWSQSLLIGFFNYVAALPLLLAALALAVRDAAAPILRRTALLAVCAVALFYLHLSAFVLFAPCALIASLTFA